MLTEGSYVTLLANHPDLKEHIMNKKNLKAPKDEKIRGPKWDKLSRSLQKAKTGRRLVDVASKAMSRTNVSENSFKQGFAKHLQIVDQANKQDTLAIAQVDFASN